MFYVLCIKSIKKAIFFMLKIKYLDKIIIVLMIKILDFSYNMINNINKNNKM